MALSHAGNPSDWVDEHFLMSPSVRKRRPAAPPRPKRTPLAPPAPAAATPAQEAVQGVMYGLINAILVVPVMLAFAQIIYRDPLFAPFMPTLDKLVLFSAMMHQLSFLIFSSLPFAVGQVQDAGLIFLSQISSGIVHELRDESTEVTVASTVVVIATCTAMLGLALIITGKLGFASFVQYLPMPVIGGYLAYIGFFCGEAGLSMMTGVPIKSIADWAGLANERALTLLAPGVVLGVLLFLTLKRFQHFAILPACMVLIPVSFYLVLFLYGASLQEARDFGWVAPLTDTPGIAHVWEFFEFDQVQWRVLPDQLTTWLAMYFVVGFSSCLDVAAIEMELGTSLDYNRELSTVGVSNLLSGLAGGATGSYIFSQTIFTMRSGTRSRLNGLTIVLCELLVVLLPVSVIAFVPKYFFGALLTFVAVDLMAEWLFHARARMSLLEYCLVLLTFVFINIFGVEGGMVIGIVFAGFNFIVHYSKVPVTERLFIRSNHIRNFEQRTLLANASEQIVTLALHGFIFFGSTINIINSVKQHVLVVSNEGVESPLPSPVAGAGSVSININEQTPLVRSPPGGALRQGVAPGQGPGKKTRRALLRRMASLGGMPLPHLDVSARSRFLIVDFFRVTGVDVTAARSCFLMLKQMLKEHNIRVAYTRMPPEVESLLDVHSALGDDVVTFATLDEGLEWAEDQLVAESAPSASPGGVGVGSDAAAVDEVLRDYLRIPLSPSQAESVRAYFSEQQAAEGEFLFKIDDQPTRLYFVATGTVELLLPPPMPDQPPRRLLRVSTGGIIGDLSFYLQDPYRFSARCTSPCRLFCLTTDSLQRMRSLSPDLCADVQTAVLRSMALQVTNNLTQFASSV